MIPAARLQSALEVLETIDSRPQPADSILNQYFRAHRFMGSSDRAVVAEHVYGTLRAWARLGWVLEQQKAEPSPRLRLMAKLILVDGNKADSAAGLFNGSQHGPTPLTTQERRLLHSLPDTVLEPSAMPQAVRLECPEWAEAGMKATLGESFEAELCAMQSAAPMDLRVNTLKSTREAVFDQLRTDGLKVEMGRLTPWALRVQGRPPLVAHPLFQQGAVEVQDEGSQTIALALDPQPGERVVDFCAGAGGKTLALAAMMNSKGTLIACDILPRRLAQATLRFRRAGLSNTRTQLLTGVSDPWIKRHAQSFHRVLVDAPCSGSGTWRRNPDARWRRLGPDLAELIQLQAQILASAARLVRPGGRLVYATCSLLVEENDQQIDNFIMNNSEFKKVPISLLDKEHTPLRLWPARNGTDGFFAAALQRVQE